MDASGPQSRQENIRADLASRVTSFPENSNTVLKEDKDGKSEVSLYVVHSKKSPSNDDVAAPSSLPQRRKLFNVSLKLSRNRWVSLGHDKPTRKNRVLKSEKSMDDAQFLKGKQSSSLCGASSSKPKKCEELDQDIDLDTLPEEYCLEPFTDTLRRGSICEEMEKEIFHEGISLHKMRKAMVIQQTLNDRFLM